MREEVEKLFEEDPNWELTWDHLLTPWALGLGVLWLSVLVALGCFVTAGVDATKTAKKANNKEGLTRVSIQFWEAAKGLLNPKEASSQWTKFWRKLPRRMWNFYIESLIIPNYRHEWGKYKAWSYKSPDRVERSEEDREILRITRQQEKMKAKLAAEDPHPMPHNHAECQRLKFNINGTIFETQLRTLNRYPDTLLGDPERRIKHYDPKTDSYYFDRLPASFEAILYFYQSGGFLRRPENVHVDVFYDDAEFYELPEDAISNFRIEEGLGKKITAVDEMPQNLLQRKLWLLLDYPESSIQARVVAILSVFVIIVSITQFCIETFPEFSATRNETMIIEEKDGSVRIVKFDNLNLRDPFFFTETICSIWFTFEFFARLSCSPSKWQFLGSVNNVIDFVSIVPYYVTLVTESKGAGTGAEPGADQGGGTAPLSILRVIRLVRIFRIFKLSRHSRGLQILGQTLSNSMSELFLLIFFVFLGVILFSSCLYFAEQPEEGEETNFTSIPAGFWFSVITMTTVGFGDMVPRTVGGKIVGSLCAITGVLTIALPVPVIVSNFNYFYHQSIDQQEFNFTRTNHVEECPYRPSEGKGSIEVSNKKDHNTIEVMVGEHGHISIRKTVHHYAHFEDSDAEDADAVKDEGVENKKNNRKSGSKK